MMPALVWGQTKPASPVLQDGWSTSCVRALALNEGSGTTLTDLSGTATVSLNTASWASDSEGNYWTGGGEGIRYIELNTGLPGASVSTYSWYMRIKWTHDGFIGGYAATFTGSGSIDVQFLDPSGENEMRFSITNASSTCVQCNPGASGDLEHSPETKYNVIGTYDGDSIKVYLNGVKVCARAQTGDIKNSGYTTRVGQGLNNSGGCSGSTSTAGSAANVYTTCIWQRVLTAEEIAAIEVDPYVMFREPSGQSRRRVIIVE